MRESDNRVRKLHEALVAVASGTSAQRYSLCTSCVGAELLSEAGDRCHEVTNFIVAAISFSAANLAFSAGLFRVAHLLKHVSTVTEECGRMVSFYLREAQWQ